jgi:hypothetical protein
MIATGLIEADERKQHIENYMLESPRIPNGQQDPLYQDLGLTFRGFYNTVSIGFAPPLFKEVKLIGCFFSL